MTFIWPDTLTIENQVWVPLTHTWSPEAAERFQLLDQLRWPVLPRTDGKRSEHTEVFRWMVLGPHVRLVQPRVSLKKPAQPVRAYCRLDNAPTLKDHWLTLAFFQQWAGQLHEVERRRWHPQGLLGLRLSGACWALLSGRSTAPQIFNATDLISTGL